MAAIFYGRKWNVVGLKGGEMIVKREKKNASSCICLNRGSIPYLIGCYARESKTINTDYEFCIDRKGGKVGDFF